MSTVTPVAPPPASGPASAGAAATAHQPALARFVHNLRWVPARLKETALRGGGGVPGTDRSRSFAVFGNVFLQACVVRVQLHQDATGHARQQCFTVFSQGRQSPHAGFADRQTDAQLQQESMRLIDTGRALRHACCEADGRAPAAIRPWENGRSQAQNETGQSPP